MPPPSKEAPSRGASNFRANNPLFKERAPDLHAVSRGFVPELGLEPTRRSSTPESDSSLRGRRRPRTAKHRLPGWESSSRSTDRSGSTELRVKRNPLEPERAPRSGTRAAESPERLRCARCPEARRTACRANGEVVERTRMPSRRSEPRFFTAALCATPAEPRKGVHFSRAHRRALDGARRRPRGRKDTSVAQHATETTRLRRPNDVLRNVSPASQRAASFAVTLAMQTVTIKPKTRAKRDFFVHRMLTVFHHLSR